MHRTKAIASQILLALVLFSCIKPYEPEIDVRVATKYVVSGQLTDQEGYQEVTVSMTATLENPEFIPVDGCQVRLEDDRGNIFGLTGSGEGKYREWIGKDYLQAGVSYKVFVITPSGDILSSDYDRMPDCPEVGPVYYLREDIPTIDPARPLKGIQFYVDLDGAGFDTRYFKWDLEETWEYKVRYPLEWYYDGGFHQVSPPDSSRMTCWTTQPVNFLYTLTTLNLSENKYQSFPLHFVDNQNSRLLILYSLKISQVALSEAAFVYWDQMRINSSGLGGLYEKQPLAIKGNIHNQSDPAAEVLGFFSASSVRTKRIFVSSVPDLELNVPEYCEPMPLGRFLWAEFRPDEYPVYFIFNEHYQVRTLTEECYNCLHQGGINVKPDYWPE